MLTRQDFCASDGSDLTQRDASVVEWYQVVPVDAVAGTAKFGGNATAKQGVLKGAAGKAHRLNMVPSAENFGQTNGR